MLSETRLAVAGRKNATGAESDSVNQSIGVRSSVQPLAGHHWALEHVALGCPSLGERLPCERPALTGVIRQGEP